MVTAGAAGEWLAAGGDWMTAEDGCGNGCGGGRGSGSSRAGGHRWPPCPTNGVPAMIGRWRSPPDAADRPARYLWHASSAAGT